MEKIAFTFDDNETVDFFVLEETKINGVTYILVTESEDDEATVVMNDVLDITEIVETSVISTLPIQRVCKDDCKGLCQECGCNLNYETCSCNKEDVDIRFEALRGLFDK